MNTKLRFVLISVLLVAVVLGCSSPGSSTTYNIGDTGPAGGLIFYDQGSVINGWRYMECALNDQSTAMKWGSDTTTGATATAIGTGQANTNTIVGSLGAGTYAAQLCKNLTLGGYSDWFLPSKDELTQMLLLAARGLGSIITNQNYWASSEVSNSYAWTCYFDGTTVGYTNNQDKNGSAMRVRAIREFAP